jgi:hypothetical protein
MLQYDMYSVNNFNFAVKYEYNLYIFNSYNFKYLYLDVLIIM